MLKVALIGATGAVGQEFVLALNKHPWFELSTVVSSSRSAGKKYVDSLRDPSSAILRWHSRNEIPDYVRDMIVTTVDHVRPESFDLVEKVRFLLVCHLSSCLGANAASKTRR